MFKQSAIMTQQHPFVGGRKKEMQTKAWESPLFPTFIVNSVADAAGKPGTTTNPLGETVAEKWMDAPSLPADTSVGLVDEMVQHAIQDATQSPDRTVRSEALAWLWVCCPDIADQLRLPWPEATSVQQQAAAYIDHYPAC